MNTHGGHLANSYLPGSNHVVEAVQQLRGSRGAAQVQARRWPWSQAWGARTTPRCS